MGFPAGYTEVLLPKLLITTLSFLGFFRRLLLTILRSLGLSYFIEPEVDWSIRSEPDPIQSRSVSATLIRDMLPVVRYADLKVDGLSRPDNEPETDPIPESCAVCLYEFEDDDEIRRMRNCSHMFHRCCVDRWIDHDRKTCPLCRKCFVPDELQEAFNETLWAASGIPDFYSEYAPITNF